jgi:hypothetical protein
MMGGKIITFPNSGVLPWVLLHTISIMSICNPPDEEGENRIGQLQYHLDQIYLEFVQINSQ